jgi:hypothetical protein
MPDLRIIVVSWNSAEFISDCLASIPEPCRPQTIVVDNNSGDETASIVKTEFPQVRLIANPTNTGFAHAGNQGIHLSLAPQLSPRYILLLNPDTRLPAGGIEKLLGDLEAHPEIGVLAPKLVNPDGSPQPSVRRFPTYGNMLREFIGLESAYKMSGFDFNAFQEVEQPMASCLLIRREVIEQVGVFDEAFPIFFNDVDLSRRIRDAGWKTAYDPEIEVWHYRAASTELRRTRMIFEMYQALFRYFRKHDRSGWFWLKAVPLGLVIELVALVRIAAHLIRRR